MNNQKNKQTQNGKVSKKYQETIYGGGRWNSYGYPGYEYGYGSGSAPWMHASQPPQGYGRGTFSRPASKHFGTGRPPARPHNNKDDIPVSFWLKIKLIFVVSANSWWDGIANLEDWPQQPRMFQWTVQYFHHPERGTPFILYIQLLFFRVRYYSRTLFTKASIITINTGKLWTFVEMRAKTWQIAVRIE